ncbi:MAG: glycerophosphodiester phosphodiesterase [Alphaproteobacteria bacterium]|nr:glycerophosphodiester phosphodiesterase [Alphaproteobacteria bacterium]
MIPREPRSTALPWSLRPPAPQTPPPPGGLVVAHRGGLAHAPENSLEAIRTAARRGADAVELDVRVGPDGLICAHDRGQPGPRADVAVPTALDLGLRVELDVKGLVGLGPSARVAELVDRLGAHERIWATSFHPLAAWRLRALDPRLVVGWAVARSWVERLTLWQAWVDWLRVQVLAPHTELLTDARLARWHDKGLMVEAWTVDPDEAAALRAKGVSTVVDALPA